MSNQIASEPSSALRRGVLSRPLTAFVELLFPPQCTVCDAPCEPAAGEPLFCEPCSRALAIDRQARCPRCAARCSEADLPRFNCSHCRDRRTLFSSARTIGSYEATLRQAVLKAKHAAAAPLALALGERLATAIEQQPFPETPDMVVPVPRHWLRHAWRNTNPAGTIAAAVAGQLQLPLYSRVLICRKLLKQQSTLTALDRRRNVRGAFAVRWPRSVVGKRVLLVDDVMTTGATAREASRVLLAAGSAAVLVATVARSSPDW